MTRSARKFEGGSSVAAVVFDLDGTLIDSSGDIAQATNHALEQHGLRALSVDEVRGFVGDGSEALMARASGLAVSDPRFRPLMVDFYEFYKSHAIDKTTLLPHVTETLGSLSDLPLALCTNKPRATSEAVVRELGLARYFEVAVAAGDAEHVKPHPAPLQRVAELLGVDAAHLVMVGDGPQDIACARAVGARSIGLDTGVFVPVETLRKSEPHALLGWPQIAEQVRAWSRQRWPW